MKKEFGQDLSQPYRTGLAGVRIDQGGLHVEVLVSEQAWVDGQNLKRKLAGSAQAKRQLLRLLAELGGEYVLSVESADHRTILRARCSRLVDPAALDARLDPYVPGEQQIRFSVCLPVDSPLLEEEVLPREILSRLGQLYLVYQFISWSPRNDYVTGSRSGDRRTDLTHDS